MIDRGTIEANTQILTSLEDHWVVLLKTNCSFIHSNAYAKVSPKDEYEKDSKDLLENKVWNSQLLPRYISVKIR